MKAFFISLNSVRLTGERGCWLLSSVPVFCSWTRIQAINRKKCTCRATMLRILSSFPLNLFLTKPGLLLVRRINELHLYQAHSLCGFVKITCLIFSSVKHLHLWLLHTTNSHLIWGCAGVMQIFPEMPCLRSTVNAGCVPWLQQSVNTLLLSCLLACMRRQYITVIFV